MRGAFLRSLLLLAASTPAAQAQNECLADVKMPAVGQWAEYTGVMNKEPYTLRYAVVGAEEREGKSMKWLELKMEGTKKDKNMIYQVLTPGNPAEMDQAQEIVFKPGDKQAMKMNGMMMKMIRGQLEKNSVLGNLCEGVTLAGEETVTVPAGTFKAKRYHDSKHKADTWIVTDRPFIMVKSKGKDFELNLAASGEGAKSSITETPQEMPGMGGPSK
ncbi:MAG TPA: hypothetical protein VHG35_00135 [Gemmatimonadales bacterium]|nr:hypothetical protein [Gemmatimonadales bacterium]